jgi:hypothetical protein
MPPFPQGVDGSQYAYLQPEELRVDAVTTDGTPVAKATVKSLRFFLYSEPVPGSTLFNNDTWPFNIIMSGNGT